jgi:transketolase
MTATITELRAAIPGTRVPDEVLRLLARCTGDEKHSSAATSPLDVEWALYDRVLRLRPFDGAALAAVAGDAPVVTVEPYAGEVLVPAALAALAPRPVRLLPIGVPRAIARHYGTAADPGRTHGLDPASLRERIAAVLA